MCCSREILYSPYTNNNNKNVTYKALTTEVSKRYTHKIEPHACEMVQWTSEQRDTMRQKVSRLFKIIKGFHVD